MMILNKFKIAIYVIYTWSIEVYIALQDDIH